MLEMKRTIILKILLLLLPLILSLEVFAHSGGVDKNGGHKNRKDGTYHCHNDPCLSNYKRNLIKAEEALQEAKEEKRAYSKLYSRSEWKHWSDMDNDCQDTRVEILISQSSKTVTHQDGNKCEEVISGNWYDPYTGNTYQLAEKLDIDHRIALGEAHRFGGENWSAAKKERFANDPVNLIAVSLGANRSKSQKSAYQWMPTNKSYWCEYVQARQVVIDKYKLTVPKDERIFVNKITAKYCN